MNSADLQSASENDPIEIGPFAIACLTSADAIERVSGAVRQRQQLDIAICNAHTLLTALDNPAYADTLQNMTLLNDGIGVGFAGRFLHGRHFPENLNGTDLVPRLLAEIDIPLRLYLIGAGEAQVLGARAHLESVHPRHKVVGHRNGYFDDKDLAGICADISASGPDLLLVAMGNPRQEFFIARNRAHLDVPVAIGVGALFDFMSGSVARAPRLVQKAGLEWLFRLLQEPRRLFRRYIIGIPRFLAVLLKLKYGRPAEKA
ncbi:WecB/TagA/CpsF family glycosyltransferase [Roseibium sp.]|uniref:WecB/TagA/CpsF family glycosyltransferase n=2 Tax=Roseibium sp. TaxID=1936156 RepID=UPI0032672078